MRSLRLLVIFSLLFAPVQVAAAMCEINAMDTVAGLGTQITLKGCGPHTLANLSVIGPSGIPVHTNVQLDSNGNGTAPLAAKDTEQAGKYDVTFGQRTAMFTIAPDTVDELQSSVRASAGTLSADGIDEVTITAVLRDRFSNPVGNQPIALIGSRPSDDIRADSKATDEEGRISWRVRSSTPGIMTLTAYDILGRQQLKSHVSITVGSSAAVGGPLRFGASLTDTAALPATFIPSSGVDHFELKFYGIGNNNEVEASRDYTVEIRAVDKQGNVVPDYTGTVSVQSSDPGAEFPRKGYDVTAATIGEITFFPQNLGIRQVYLGVRFKTSGTQTFDIADTTNPAIKGSFSVNVINGGGGGGDGCLISVISPKDGAKISGSNVLLQGRAPSLINLKVRGGSGTVFGETDADGIFRISVPIDSKFNEATLSVAHERDTCESPQVHIIVDRTPPEIKSIKFLPERGVPGEQSQIIVQSEPDLASLTATILDTTLPLSGSGTTGIYSAIFTAPKESGEIDVRVVAKDSAGHETTVLAKWTVGEQRVSKVLGVSATAKLRSVLLSWQAVTDADLKEYKVYVALLSDPKNFLASRNTGSKATSVLLTDLVPGTTYVFTVTAINAKNAESPEQSDRVSATPLGLGLRATPGAGQVELNWQSLPDLPLLHYSLDFGAKGEELSEHRKVHGSRTSVTVKDLINDIPYVFTLTPIALNGDVLTELAESAEGTPNGSGFHYGPSDPAPDDTFDDPVEPIEELEDLPAVTDSGPSTAIILSALLLLSLAGFIGWRSYATKQELRNFLASIKKE